MKQYLITFSYMFLLVLASNTTMTRSIKRPVDKTMPSITVSAIDQNIAQSWHTEKTTNQNRTGLHKIKTPYLRLNPLIKGFDHDFFKAHYIPIDQQITFRNKQGTVKGQQLENLAEGLIRELKAGQKKITDFKVLKDSDFNYKQLSGLLILKYKNHPFVLKLSIEHPDTMTQPYSKSFIANFIFIFGGNIRHLSNFTRITNLEKIKKILSYNPYYLENIDFPRKWYWKPKDSYDLHIIWNETSHHKEETFRIPNAYATISDYIDVDPTYPQSELNKIAMKVATDVEFLIDPHAGNFVSEKGSNKYTMLDTENFRIMTGINHTMGAKKYHGWLFELAIKCLKVYGGRTKQERIQQNFQIL